MPSPTSVHVAEVTDEVDGVLGPDLPWHLAGPPDTIAVSLRRSTPRVVIGAGLGRRMDLVEATRALWPGGLVEVSAAGGTFALGGAGWLGLAAVGVLPPGTPMPLDWMTRALAGWFGDMLGRLGITVRMGRVDHAWCPGFSDVSAGGRKLAGTGFRVTRDHVAMRGMLAVQPLSAADADLLVRTHALIGVDVDPATATSLVEATGDRSWTVDRAVAALGG